MLAFGFWLLVLFYGFWVLVFCICVLFCFFYSFFNSFFFLREKGPEGVVLDFGFAD